MSKKSALFMAAALFIFASCQAASAAHYVRNPANVIWHEMGGTFYDGPKPAKVTIPGTVAGVIRRGGAYFEAVTVGQDVSFILMIENGYEIHREGRPVGGDLVLVPGSDEVYAPFDQSDFRGFPELSVSLYTPSGKLCKSVDALPGFCMISIFIPAMDNREEGIWRCSITKALGFSPDDPVLMGVIDGNYEMYNGMGGYFFDALSGTVRTPEGITVIDSDGTKIMGDGTIITLGGFVINPNRTLRDSDAQITGFAPGLFDYAPEGGSRLRDGTVILPDGSVITPGGFTIKRDGAVIPPER